MYYKQFVQAGFPDFDWWFWVLIFTLPTLKALGFWWLLRSFAKKKSVALQMEVRVARLSGLPKTVDPVTLYLSIDAVVKAGKTPVCRSGSPAHEEEEEAGVAAFEAGDSDFVYAWDADDETDRTFEIALVTESGKAAFIGLSKTLKKKELIALSEGDKTTEKTQLKSEAGDKIYLEYDYTVKKIESNLQRIMASRSALAASMRRQRLVVVLAHLVALTTAVAFIYLGIRYIFSGCFIVSIISLVAGGLIAVSSLAVLVVWAALKSLVAESEDKMKKINQLNTKFRAALCGISGILIWVFSELTAENYVGQQWFNFWATIAIVDALCFAYAFWKFDANEDTNLLFTPDFLTEDADDQAPLRPVAVQV